MDKTKEELIDTIINEQNILPRVSEGIPKENLLKLFFVVLSVFAVGN